MSELDPEYRAAWEEVRRLWRVVNDVLSRAESPVVMESSSCGCCGAMFDRQAGPDPDRWCKPCSVSRRAVAGGEPPAWSDPSDLTRISLAAAAREFGAGGEPTRPSDEEILRLGSLAWDGALLGEATARSRDAAFTAALAARDAFERARVVAAVEALPKSQNVVANYRAGYNHGIDAALRAARSATGETT